MVPLVHDTEFFNLLSDTLESISEHMTTLHSEFVNTQALSMAIGDSSHPASVSVSFRPLSSVTTHAGLVRVNTGELKVCASLFLFYCLIILPNYLLITTEQPVFLERDSPHLSRGRGV